MKLEAIYFKLENGVFVLTLRKPILDDLFGAEILPRIIFTKKEAKMHGLKEKHFTKGAYIIIEGVRVPIDIEA